jgi:small subunit ribosomal protein S4
LVSARPVNIPSFLIRAGDVIEVRERSRQVERILEAIDTVSRRGIPGWLELDKDNFKGVVKTLPGREDLTMPVQEQLVVELYSK